MKKEFLEVGKIINTHGISGEMKVEPWCDSPDVLKKIKHFYIGETEYTALSVRTGGAFPLIKFEGITTVEDAARLKNKVISAKREDIPVKEGRTFICDMIGLPVIDKNTGRTYGILKDVMLYDPHDIFVIKMEGEDVLMPNVPEYVASVDTEKGIFVTPIDGFFG